MCKEADEPATEKQPVQMIIPEDLPEPSKPAPPVENPLVPPTHVVEPPSSENPGALDRFVDLPLSDVNENSKAR